GALVQSGRGLLSAWRHRAGGGGLAAGAAPRSARAVGPTRARAHAAAGRGVRALDLVAPGHSGGAAAGRRARLARRLARVAGAAAAARAVAGDAGLLGRRPVRRAGAARLVPPPAGDRARAHHAPTLAA